MLGPWAREIAVHRVRLIRGAAPSEDSLGGVTPRVTVLTPVFNRPEYVRQAIESALAQDVPGGAEILVVDDGSTDTTPEVLASFGDQIRVIRQDNAGPAAARNRGFEEARGEFVALLDSDDIWLPGKLAAQVALLDAHPDAALAHTDVEEFFEEGRQSEWVRRPPIVSGHVLRTLLRRNVIHTMTVLLRKSVLDAIGGFDPAYPPCEDWDLWLRITERYPIVGDPAATVRTRIHEGGISADPIVVYRQAGALLEAAGQRLMTERPRDGRLAKRQAARYKIKLGRRLARSGKTDEATTAFAEAVRVAPSARLAAWMARVFPKH